MPGDRVVYSSLKLEQVLPLNRVPYNRITPTLSNKIPEIKNGSFSGLSLLGRLPWSALWSEAMLVFRVHADVCDASLSMSMVGVAAGGHVDAHDPGCHGNHIKVWDLCCLLQNPRGSLRSVLPLTAVGNEASFVAMPTTADTTESKRH